MGGLDGFLRQDIRWMVDQGYLLIRNLEFVGSGSSSPIETLGKLPGMLDKASGALLLPLVVLGVVGLIRLPNWSWRTAILLALAIPIGALVYRSVGGIPRYVYILLPGLVLLAAYGLAELVQVLRSYKRTVYLVPVLGVAVVALLGSMYLVTAREQVEKTQGLTDSSRQRELAKIANLIDDRAAVLGSRAGQLIPYLRHNELLAAKSVTEDEFVTYLSWRSGQAVKKVFQNNGVGWVLIRMPAERWEVNYHVWLREVTGKLPRHHSKLESSNLVTRVHDGKHYRLYRVHGASS